LRLYAHLGFLLTSEYNKVILSCHKLSSFWGVILCNQIWLFLLLLQKCEEISKLSFEDFHREDGGSRFFQTVSNHLPDDTVTWLRRPET
jgi:hypothetical protein